MSLSSPAKSRKQASLSPIRQISMKLIDNLPPSPADRKKDSASAHLPAFLKQTKAEIQNAFVDLEWQQRHRLAEGAQPTNPPSQWMRARGLGDPMERNRYVNIEPFASNRVKLKVGGDGDDYINASPILLGTRRYISTQGPKQTSVSHFYRMLAQETSTSAVVVMLTQTHEAGREKCWPYFPDKVNAEPLPLEADRNNEDDTFQGQVDLLSSKEDKSARCVIRHIRLRTRNNDTQPWREQNVWHLLFGGWPDFSIPEGDDRKALVNLVALSRRLNAEAPAPDESTNFPKDQPHTNPSRQDLNPRIVHCSAGVGRTGTFIALDYMLSLLESGKLDRVSSESDPIAETVNRLREQRMMMVQGESQFHFLYEVMREKWIERWRSQQR